MIVGPAPQEDPRTERAQPAQPRVSPWWLALLAGPLSFGIAAPALLLNEVARDLGVSLVAATSVVTAFGWGIAVGTPLMGVLVARRGPRDALRVSAVLVAAGAALVVTVPVLPMLVVGAGLQALGAAGMTVTAMSLAGSAAAMGMVTATLASVGALAPLIGSQVSAALSWPAALALTAVSLAALPAVLKGARAIAPATRAAGNRFDAVGAVLLVGLVTALVFIPQRPLVAGICAAVLAVLFGTHVRRRPDGFVPTALLTTPRFRTAAGLAFALAVVNFGILYAAPGLLAAPTGWTTAQLGVALLVPYLCGGALSWFLVAASGRLGFRALIAVLACAAATAMAFVVFGTAWLPLLFAGMVTGSLAAATGQGALTLHAAAVVPDPDRPTAIGMFNLCFLLGVAFGPVIAALATP